MTYDPSKKINVSYNHLNLPRLVEFDNDDNITYTYTATGTKLRKTVTSWKTPTGGTTDYSGQFLYQDNELMAIFTPNGRLMPVQYNDETFWKHEYNLKDYLGNTRILPQHERSSMGQVSGGAYRRSDWGNKIAGNRPYDMSVYFPHTSNIYNISEYQITYIRNIRNDYKRFYYGTLNHR